jgi:hypothetical protein
MTFAPASTNEPPCFLGDYPNVPPCSVRVPNVPPVSTTIRPIWGITCTSIRSRTRYTELESIRITPEAQQGSLPAILKEAWIKGKFKQVRKFCAFLYSHHLHVVHYNAIHRFFGPKYPRIPPLRGFFILRSICNDAYVLDQGTSASANAISDALSTLSVCQHKELDKKIYEVFENKEPALPALLTTIIHDDKRLVDLRTDGVKKLVESYLFVSQILKKAWVEGTFKEIRKLCVFTFTTFHVRILTPQRSAVLWPEVSSSNSPRTWLLHHAWHLQ